MLQSAFSGIINDSWHLQEHFILILKNMQPLLHLASSECFLENQGTHTLSLSSSLFVNVPCPLCPRRKSNWIADRMKKLIKPRGGGREGRALFTAAGSVENLADSTEFTSDTHTPHPGETTQTQPSTLPLFLSHTHKQPTGFHKDMLTCSPHQARLQACIQIIS